MRMRSIRRLFFVSAAALAVPLVQTNPVAAQPDVSPFSGCNEPHAAVVNPLSPQNVAVAECNSIAVSTDFGRTFAIGFQVLNTLPAGAGDWKSLLAPAVVPWTT